MSVLIYRRGLGSALFELEVLGRLRGHVLVLCSLSHISYALLTCVGFPSRKPALRRCCLRCRLPVAWHRVYTTLRHTQIRSTANLLGRGSRGSAHEAGFRYLRFFMFGSVPRLSALCRSPSTLNPKFYNPKPKMPKP